MGRDKEQRGTHTLTHVHTDLLLRNKRNADIGNHNGHTYTPLQTHAQTNTHEITMYVVTFFFVRAASTRVPRHSVAVRHTQIARS